MASKNEQSNYRTPNDPTQVDPLLENRIGGYIDDRIKTPIFYSISHDPVTSLRWSNAFAMLRLSEMLIVESDKERVSEFSDKSGENILEKNLYLGYLGKVLTSSLILLGSTDYIGSLILMRSVFELLVSISTVSTGGMKKRIWDIGFLSEFEKRRIYNIWNNLNPWAHPYGKWYKEICPKFYGCGENFHPKLFESCLDSLDSVLDFMLTVTAEKFCLEPSSFLLRYKEISGDISPFEISNLKMFESRLRNE